MNATNPFQVPSCFQINHERRRRERFKKTFIAIIGAGVLLLIGLLIEGCVSERSQTTAPTSVVTDLPETQPNPAPVVAETKPAALPEPKLPVAVPSTSPVSAANVAAPASHATTVYIVKSGDTLTRIAKTHGTTVKTLKALNGLDTDSIAVGKRLKLPAA